MGSRWRCNGPEEALGCKVRSLFPTGSAQLLTAASPRLSGGLTVCRVNSTHIFYPQDLPSSLHGASLAGNIPFNSLGCEGHVFAPFSLFYGRKSCEWSSEWTTVAKLPSTRLVTYSLPEDPELGSSPRPNGSSRRTIPRPSVYVGSSFNLFR